MRPLDDTTIIIPEPDSPRLTKSGLIASVTEKQFLKKGFVLEIGPGNKHWRTGRLLPTIVQKGDTVAFSRHANMSEQRNVLIDGVLYERIWFVQERDITVIIREVDGEEEVIPNRKRFFGREITPAKEERILDSGIVIPAGFGESNNLDEGDPGNVSTVRLLDVIAVGPGEYTGNATELPVDFEEGNTVMINRWSGWEFLLGSDTYYVADLDQVMMVVE